MRSLVAVLCLITTPALADVTGLARVIDGDTLEVQGQRIRLYGIDAPESRQLCFIDGKRWECGKDATIILADYINNRPVTCQDLGRDRYKRIIARCSTAGEDIGGWMVQQGLALAYRRYSLDYVDEEAGAQAALRPWAESKCGTPGWRSRPCARASARRSRRRRKGDPARASLSRCQSGSLPALISIRRHPASVIDRHR